MPPPWPNMMPPMLNRLKNLRTDLCANPIARHALWLAAALFILDQLSKYAVLASPIALGRVTVTPFLDFVLVWNKGISYGLFNHHSAGGQIILAALGLAICIGLLCLLAASPSRLYGLGLGMIIGGALGNIADRLIHGAVVDFISLHTQNYAWYVFNVADIWITLGVVLAVLDTLRPKHEGRK